MALADVTGVAERYGDLPEGTAARSRWSTRGSNPSRSRSSAVAHVRAPARRSKGARIGLAAKLHLLNGALVNGKLTAHEGRLHRLLEAGRSDGEILGEFYLRALTRMPTAEESAYWRGCLGRASSPAERAAMLEDFAWSLLNSREFLTNH